jgi:hypothetical protein
VGHINIDIERIKHAGSVPRYHMPSIMTQFPPAAKGWGTNYSILDTVSPHQTNAGIGGGHHLKGTKLGHDPYRSFLSHLNSCGQTGSCHPPCVLTWHAPVTPVASLESLPSWTSDPGASILRRCGHLMPDKIRCIHSLPHTPSNRHSRAGIHPIATWESGSIMRWTCIRVMMTMTQDRPAPQVQDFPWETQSTKDLDSQHRYGLPFPLTMHLTHKGGARPRRPLQWMGQHPSEGIVPSPGSESPQGSADNIAPLRHPLKEETWWPCK